MAFYFLVKGIKDTFLVFSLLAGNYSRHKSYGVFQSELQFLEQDPPCVAFIFLIFLKISFQRHHWLYFKESVQPPPPFNKKSVVLRTTQSVSRPGSGPMKASSYVQAGYISVLTNLPLSTVLFQGCFVFRAKCWSYWSPWQKLTSLKSMALFTHLKLYLLKSPMLNLGQK